MDAAALKRIIAQNGGDEKVLAFQFDTNGRYVYHTDTEGPFNFDNAVVEGEYLKYTEEDMFGNPYVVIKNIEGITGIIFATDNTIVKNLSIRDILG